MKSTNKERGVTLVEVIAALAIGSVVLVGLAAMIQGTISDSKGQLAAQYQSQLADAARRYLAANYSDLVGSTPTTDSVVTIDVAALTDENLLPPGFGAANSYLQTACILVRQPVQGSGKLDALVVTSGGSAIPDKDVAAVAAMAGLGGGYIVGTDPGTARGASWALATDPYRNAACAGASAPALTGAAGDAGHLVTALFADGPGAADFVYRDAVPGHPELNTMNTPLNMANNAVVNAGDACSGAGIAVNANNEIMKCGAGGQWEYVSTWKPPVNTYTDLQNQASDNVGDVRLVLDKNRAFAYAGNGNWTALAVDQNGDMNVERDVKAGRNIYGVDFDASNNVNANQDVNATGSVFAGEDVVANGWLVAGDAVLIYGTRSPGQQCNIPTNDFDSAGNRLYIDPIGTVANDDNATLLSCAGDATFRYQNGTYSP